MEIDETTGFHIVDSLAQADKTPAVLLENRRLKKQVKVLGKILESQYCIDDQFLLIISAGNPFEEALYIYCLNGQLQILDLLELSAIYAEGMLRNLTVSDSGEISFSFFENGERWALKILPHPKL